MRVSEAIVRILEKEGITDAFGIPGAGINPVYKYLNTSASIRHHTMRHEEAAVHAADGFFRASGRIAAAICTSGPGATNFVTGLYTANIDSIPVMAITGQNITALLGKDAFQCVDIAQIAAPVCKKTWCVKEPEAVPSVFAEAFYTARAGKPGVVLVDLPLDVQMAEIDFDIGSYSPRSVEPVLPEKELIRKAVDLLASAQKPVMIMGGGVILSQGETACVALAEFMKLPVIATYMAKGGIPEDHPLNAQLMGIQVGASSIGNRVFLDSDVVLGIGCRFTDRHTGNISVYKGDRKFIHVNIEPSEIGKIIEPEIGIVSDAKAAAEALLAEAERRGGEWKAAHRVKMLPEMRKTVMLTPGEDGNGIHPKTVYHEINRIFDDETLYTTGCGNNQIWSGQYQRMNKPRKYLPSGGAGTLGFDIPAAIGASVAAGRAKTVCVMGDFGFTFLVEELAVAAKERLPVSVIILNNANLSLIRQNQKYAYDYEYAVEMKENKGIIDYVKVAEGFGCKAERVQGAGDLPGALERAKDADGPYVVEIFVEDETDCNMGIAIDSIRVFI
ncbi:MAG: glyoxylate carboligase [Spirochaetales bacterium]|nr:glyoxylate carboligase [Spirochaetales bacterium]